MASAFSYSVVFADGVHVVTFRGELDMATATGLADWLVEVSGSTVLIDLDQLTFMDSSGIAVIVEARNRILATGDALMITRPRENVRRVFETTGLSGWICDWDPTWSDTGQVEANTG